MEAGRPCGILTLRAKGDPGPRAGLLLPVWLALAAAVGVLAPSAVADDYEDYADARRDAVLRRTDLGGDGRVDEGNHAIPDLLKIAIGAWAPRDPAQDLLAGEWDEGSGKAFLRVDLVFDGLVNPPGPIDFRNGGFDPYRFGPHPVYGFLEMDADEYEYTGGELDFPSVHPLGASARFGGVPDDRSELRDRYARDGRDCDGDCRRGRDVEYSGEEFHLALTGEEYSRREVLTGDQDGRFEAGEAWLTYGTWLHRAHGFEEFSFACGFDTGIYDPESALYFIHDANRDETRLILMFPLTPKAASEWWNEPKQSMDCDPYNHASIQEALDDLVLSARYWEGRQAECKRVIEYWSDGRPDDELRPRKWQVLGLFGMSYAEQQPQHEQAYFVWTDIFPDAEPGDVNGRSGVDDDDFFELYDWVQSEDGGPSDADGTRDGRVTWAGFARSFAVYDVDYDGVIDQLDARWMIVPGDFDGDRDVDLDDWRGGQDCMKGPQSPIEAQCRRLDLDLDGDVDLEDYAGFMVAFGAGG